VQVEFTTMIDPLVSHLKPRRRKEGIGLQWQKWVGPDPESYLSALRGSSGMVRRRGTYRGKDGEERRGVVRGPV